MSVVDMHDTVPSLPAIGRNGHSKVVTEDESARMYINALLAGNKLEKPAVGRWEQVIRWLDDAFDRDPASVSNVLQAFINYKKYPGLKELMQPASPPAGAVLSLSSALSW